MAMNGTAAPTATRLTANALARLMEEKPDSATFQPVLQIAGALFVLSSRMRERIVSFIHSFILSRGSFLFPFREERCGPFASPRVLMTRATTAKRRSSSSLRRLSFSFDSLSLSFSRASRGGGSEKPSRQSPIFEKMRETTAAPKTQRRVSTSASLSLSLKKRHSLTRTTTASSLLLLLSTDIRKIQNKSGEPETVENTRWRIMIRCDTRHPSSLSRREKEARERFKIVCTFFFLHASSIRYPTRKATARTKPNASLERTLTA